MNNKPVLYIDADACPVTNLAISIAGKAGLRVVLICDTAHQMARAGAETITVDKGADSADFAIVARVSRGDIVLTQDYGVAAMALAKGAHCINQNGMLYTAENIDGLLGSRHVAAKVRRGGGRLKGPPPRSREQDVQFAREMETLVNKLRSDTEQ